MKYVPLRTPDQPLQTIYAVTATQDGTETLCAAWDEETNVVLPGATTDYELAQMALELLEKVKPEGVTLKVVQFVRMS